MFWELFKDFLIWRRLRRPRPMIVYKDCRQPADASCAPEWLLKYKEHQKSWAIVPAEPYLPPPDVRVRWHKVGE
jgi:hypothetical protein